MKNTQIKELEKLSFEDALRKLEEIVDKMEGGNLPLDQMIKFFEEGTALSNMCGKKLKELEKKIEILVKATPDGGEWKDFDENSKAPSAPEDDEDITDDDDEIAKDDKKNRKSSASAPDKSKDKDFLF